MGINKDFFRTTIRVPKAHSAFIYFQLEANEGVCFYSTLKSSLKESYRDIMVTSDMSYAEETKRILSFLNKTIPFEYINNEESLI